MQQLLALLALCLASESFAVTYHAGSTVGLMQQPTSNFYHGVYGAYGEAALDSEALSIRASYAERPMFENQGYRDQDSFSFVMFGSHFSKSKGEGLYGYFGGGQTFGYIQKIGEEARGPHYRSFKMNGIAVAMEYRLQLGAIRLAAHHTHFMGYGGPTEFEAYVAWPYNLSQLQIGYQW